MSDDIVSNVFPSKWEKVLKSMPEFKDNADASSPDELRDIIVKSEGNIYTVEQEMAADNKLNSAKELVKEYSQSYRDAKKAQTAKIKYALYLLECKGEDIDHRE